MEKVTQLFTKTIHKTHYTMKSAEEILKDNMIFPQDVGNLKYERIKKAMSEYASQGREWIEIKKGGELPQLIEGKDYSENVFTVSNGRLCVMAFCYINCDEDSGYAWCDCSGYINGDPEFDDDYKPTHWMKFPALPPPPKNS